MPGSADFIQRAVHALEAGGLAVWIRRGLIVVVVVGLGLYYLIGQFHGLATAEGMDQAQIGRAIASGEGFSTKFARPLAVWQLKAHGKDVSKQIWVDTYNAPLPPLVDAIALLMVKSHWKMSTTDLVYTGDKAVAVASVIFFLLSVLVFFFIARRLFDQRIATLTCAVILLSDALWQYSLSGLPQMLLLFLFNCTLYCLIRAVEARYAELPATVWLIASGAGFGLMALTHALTIWIFVAALIFAVFFFAPRGWAAIIMLVTFLVVYAPWLIRTNAVSGNFGGIAIYAIFDGIIRSESAWMRQLTFDSQNIGVGSFRTRIAGNLVTQFGRIFQYLGWNIVAAAFFFALLHPFKRLETSAIRWLTLAMWGGATFGMALYGINEDQGFAANQLHVIFIPIMACYGFAYLLVQWTRLDPKFPFARAAFITLLFFLCGYPMLHTMLLSSRKPQVVWPPYVPPYIGAFNSLMRPEEITASDIPWAIAWYANRRSVWVPDTIKNFSELSDYKTLGGTIAALYLTPVSGSSNKLGDIMNGEYKDWAPIILRSGKPNNFPLQYPNLSVGLNEECIFISDTERIKTRPK